MEEQTRRRAIAGDEFWVASFQRTAREVRASGALDWVVGVPLSPVRALEGVGSGAAAIHDFNDTALRFSRVVEGIPVQLRWQAELLLYDVEDRESLSNALASLDTISQSARLASEAVAKLPADLHSLLEDSERTLERLQKVVASAQEFAVPLRDT